MDGKRMAGIRAKLDRADEHIQQLKVLVDVFVEQNGTMCSIVPEPEPLTGDVIHRVRLTHPLNPNRMAVIVGDAVHNMRSALDHLTWQLVEAGGTHTPSHRTAFPVCDTAQAFTNAVGQGKIRGVTKDAARLIGAIQPYATGVADLLNLSELDNIDKHRLLLVVGSCVVHERMRISVRNADLIALRPGETLGDTTFDFLTDDDTHRMVDDGDVYCRQIGPHNGKLHYEIKPALAVSFRDPESLRQQPATDVLDRLRATVGQVIDLFAPHL